MYPVLLILHLLGAAIWVGGHLILSTRYLPQALKEQDPNIIRAFEQKYEPLGLPALLLQVITGVLLAYHYGVPIQYWFSFSSPIEVSVSIKLLLLFATILLAIHARLFIIPTLNKKSLPKMAMHIVLITIIAVVMLIVGSTIRMGGI